MLSFPDRPATITDDLVQSDISLRYEDLSQDGRLTLLGMPHTLNAIWRELSARQAAGSRSGRDRSGAIPLLARMIFDGDDEPILMHRPLRVIGAWQLAHARTESGEVDRIFFNAWSEMHGPRGRAFGATATGDGGEVRAGRLFAEHVFTRPFAAPELRKVVRLDAPGAPELPEARWDLRPAAAAMALPEGAHPLDELAVDVAPLSFGLDHCDANQHVNSLVYPRLFIDAALRRFAALGRPTRVLARRCEVAFRKPSFAGDPMRIALQAFELDGRLGAAGCYLGAGASAAPGSAELAKAHCFISMIFG